MSKSANLMLPLGMLVILMHLLRNLSYIYYIFFSFALLFFLIEPLRRASNRALKWVGLVIILFVYVVFCSLLADSGGEIYIGVVRLFYIAPVVIYFLSMRITYDESMRLWRIIFWFILVSACSILSQYFIGPISWFAEHSERAGTDRFASLAGSLTVFGAIVGVAIVLVKYIFENKIFIWIAILMLVLCAFLSLQKMAFFSMILALVIISVKSCADPNAKVRSLPGPAALMFSGILTIGICYLMFANYFVEHFLYFSLVFTSDASSVGDVSALDSMIDRMTDLPLEAINYWDYLNILLGVGVFGGSGGLGYSDVPMAHNLIVEIFLIFGALVGSLAIWVVFKYLTISIILVVRHRNKRVFLAAASFVILVLTGIFSGGIFYQPVLGVVFWFSLSELYRLNQNVEF